MLLKLIMTPILFFTSITVALAENKSSWQDWQPQSQQLPFDSGFSNLELGGYMDYEYYCKQKAQEANTTETYWYRLNDLVEVIGTGKVEWGCKINDQFVITYGSTAILSGLEYPVCLKVNSDIGNGLRVRKSANLESQPVGFLFNGMTVFTTDSPAYIPADSSGREWLEITRRGLRGWVSLRAKEGEHINLHRCNLK
jgi:hypothetical protein